MKRSEINKIIIDAIETLKEHKFYLPKFAYWSLEDWKSKGEEIREIIDNQMGWDITDFGSGDFSKKGLVLFTIRNGNLKDIEKGGKNYCEKIMIVKEGQLTPMHYHFQKNEDIINRGGGNLLVQLYNKTDDNKLADSDVTVSMDGIRYTFKAGTVVKLEPGDSITIPSYLYHKFWAEEGYGKVLVGEVSSVNDDNVDNFFYEKVGRFPEIEEDEEPKYLLYDDYKKFLNF
ncbi:MAG: D-lyxose/D-mannose family sugar isomerase [Promethearchaeota archaeon]